MLGYLADPPDWKAVRLLKTESYEYHTFATVVAHAMELGGTFMSRTADRWPD
jgi:hypothetical protein